MLSHQEAQTSVESSPRKLNFTQESLEDQESIIVEEDLNEEQIDPLALFLNNDALESIDDPVTASIALQDPFISMIKSDEVVVDHSNDLTYEMGPSASKKGDLVEDNYDLSMFHHKENIQETLNSSPTKIPNVSVSNPNTSKNVFENDATSSKSSQQLTPTKKPAIPNFKLPLPLEKPALHQSLSQRINAIPVQSTPQNLLKHLSRLPSPAEAGVPPPLTFKSVSPSQSADTLSSFKSPESRIFQKQTHYESQEETLTQDMKESDLFKSIQNALLKFNIQEYNKNPSDALRQVLATEVYLYVRKSIKELKDQIETLNQEQESARVLQNLIDEKVNAILNATSTQKAVCDAITEEGATFADTVHQLSEIRKGMQNIHRSEMELSESLIKSEHESDVLEMRLEKVNEDIYGKRRNNRDGNHWVSATIYIFFVVCFSAGMYWLYDQEAAEELYYGVLYAIENFWTGADIVVSY